MRFLYLSTAWILAICLINTHIAAQAVYSLSGPCSDENVSEDVIPIAVVDDLLFYVDESGDPFQYIVNSATDPLSGPDTLLSTNSFVHTLEHNDTFFVWSATRLYRLVENELEELYVAADVIHEVFHWNGQMFYVGSSTNGNFRDGLFKLDLATQTSTEIYTSIFGGIKGAAPLDAGIVLVANGATGKELVLSDGTAAGTSAYFNLFPGGSEFFPNSRVYMTYDNDQAFFFYGVGNNGEVDENVLFTTNGTAEGSVRLASYERLSFVDVDPPVILDNVFFFLQREFGVPSGTTLSLHRSDGTVPGTYNLDPTPTTSYFNTRVLSSLDGAVYALGFGTLYTATPASTEASIFTSGVTGVTGFNDSLLLGYGESFDNIELNTGINDIDDFRLVADINPATPTSDSRPRRFVSNDSIACFVASPNEGQAQIFTYNLTRTSPPAVALQIEAIETIPETDTGLGSIDITAIGSAVSFTLDSTIINTTGFFGNLNAGDYEILVTDAYGCTETLSVTVELSSATDEFAHLENDRFRIYPNPIKAGSELNILTLDGSDELVTIEMYNAFGQRVLRHSIQTEANIKLGAARSGYFVLIGYAADGRPLLRKALLVE